jgi:TonB family protein
MSICNSGWRRRVPPLLLAMLLHALVITALLRGLTVAGHAPLQPPILVRIVSEPARAVPMPPALHPPRLPAAAMPLLIPAAVSLPAIQVLAAPSAATNLTADSPPQITYRPPDTDAYYPLAARQSFSQGQVWTRVCVYSTGEIASVSLARGSGDSALDEAALTVARQTRWKPAMAHGKPVARCCPLQVDFTLTQRPLE